MPELEGHYQIFMMKLIQQLKKNKEDKNNYKHLNKFEIYLKFL